MTALRTFKRICVFCGSSHGANPSYTEAAKNVGGELARRGIGLVYGGGNVGLMGVVADAVLAAGIVDEDAPHRLGGRGEEMSAAVPVRFAMRSHQPQVRFVDQGRGLQRLPGGFLCQSLSGEAP